MTKIGEGNSSAKQPSIDTYKSQLDTSSEKFLNALDQYNKSESGQEQDHLRSIMDQQMGLIQSSVRELKKSGIHKEGAKVVKDYIDYKDEQTGDNYTCLRNDIETLREYNKK